MGVGGSRTAERRERRRVLLALLRQIRQEAGLRQVELAERLGKPQSFVSKYESGERRLDLLEIEDLCRAVGLSPVAFVKKFERASQRAVRRRGAS